MPQTSYTQDQAIGFAGQLADLSFKRVVSALNKEGVAIPFGVAVTKRTAAGEYELPDAAGDKIYGIVVHSHDVDQNGLTGVEGVAEGGTMNVLEEGVVLVKVEEAVDAHDDVYVRHTAHTGEATLAQLGAFRKSADTVSTVDTAAIVKGARYRTAAAAGGIAEVEFSKLVNLS